VTLAFDGYVYAYVIEKGEDISISLALTYGDVQNSSSGYPVTTVFDGLSADTEYVAYFYGVSSIDGSGMSFGAFNATATSFTTQPTPPELESVTFSSTGAYLTIMFDSNTDLGAVYGLSNPFECDDVFIFPGSSDYCEWGSSKSITAYLDSKSTLKPGNSFTLRKNRIKAACKNGYCYYRSFSGNSTVDILSPSNAPVPVIKLIYSSYIGKCDDIEVSGSGSLGSGGRSMYFNWNIASSNDTELKSLLNSYGNSSSSIYIPNSYIEQGTTYSFSVSVTNFFNEVATKEFTVTVETESLAVIYLNSGSELSIIRNEDLSIFASAQVQACSNSSASGGLSYSWALTSGGNTLTLSSTSSDPRYFKLDAYSLEANHTYVATVTVTTPSGRANTASVEINVEKADLVAIIDGGSSRSVQLSEGIQLDASVSLDENNEDGNALGATYTWLCFNSTGGQCSFELDSTPTLNVTSNILNPSVYTFTVIVSDGDRSSNASASITVVQDLIPSVSISSAYTSGKINPLGTIKLTGGLDLKYSATSTWALEEDSSSVLKSNSDLSTVALTSLTKTLTSGGDYSHYLVIDGTYLVSGGTYQFTFSSSYTGSDSSSFAQIKLTVNSPPTSGTVTVTPEVGTSISDYFDLVASDWTDDFTDFPLRYAFYYIDSSDTAILLRGSELGNTYEEVNLPQGIGSNYSLTVEVYVSDIYGGAATSTTEITVYPYSATLSEAGSAAADLFSTLLEDYNTGGMYSNVQNFAAFLSATNCTFAPECADLNREACETGETDHTCGACLDGYYGSLVNFTSACYTVGSSNCTNGVQDAGSESDVDCGGDCAPCALGKSCDTGSDCSFGLCSSGICAMPTKTCEGNCSGQGTCFFSGPNSVSLTEEECTYDNIYCTPVCQCFEGYYGSSCSMTENDLVDTQNLVSTLMNSTFSAMTFSDGTGSDVNYISSTFNSLSSNLDYIDAATQESFLNSSGNTIIDSLNLEDYEETATEQLISVLGTFLSTDLISDSENVGVISSGVNNLASTILGNLVAGQTPSETSTDGISITAAVFDTSDSDISISVGLTDEEIASGSLAPQADLGQSLAGSSEVGVSLSEFSSNPYGQAFNSTNSTQLSSVVRLGLSGAEGSELNFLITLQNYFEQTYSEPKTEQVEYFCEFGSTETKYVLCGNNTLKVECDGTAAAGNLTCTSGGILPRCILWDDNQWDDTSCLVQSYNASSTVCNCTIDAATRRRLQDSSSENYDVGSDLSSVGSTLAQIYGNSGAITDPSAIEENIVVFIVMGAVVVGVPLLAVFLLFLHFSYKKFKSTVQKEGKKKRSSIMAVGLDQGAAVLKAFNTATKDGQISVYLDVLTEESDWIQMCQDTDAYYKRMVRVVMLIADLLTIMFWDAILTVSINDPCEDSGTSGATEPDTSSACSNEDVIYFSLYVTVFAMALTLPFVFILELIYHHTLEIELPDKENPWKRTEEEPVEIDKSTSNTIPIVEEARDVLEQEDDMNMPMGSPEEDIKIPTESNMQNPGNEAHLSQKGEYHTEEEEIERRVDAFISEYSADKKANKKKRLCGNLRVLLTKQNEEQDREELRYIIKKSMKLENEVKDLVQRGKSAKAEALILEAAKRDSLGYLETQAIKYSAKAKSKIAVDEEEEEQAKEDEEYKKWKALTRQQVLRRHYIGWVVLVLYCLWNAYYTCIFGITYGARTTNSWLLSFLIGFFEDLAVLLPLKLFLLLSLFPKAAPKKIRVTRLKALPQYAPSIQLAEAHSNFQSSQLLLNRHDAASNKDLIPNDLVEIFKFDGELRTFKSYMVDAQRILLKFMILFVVVAPPITQELVVHTWASLGFNFLIVGIVSLFFRLVTWIGFAASITILVCGGLIFVFMLATLLSKRLRRKVCCTRKSKASEKEYHI